MYFLLGPNWLSSSHDSHLFHFLLNSNWLLAPFVGQWFNALASPMLPITQLQKETHTTILGLIQIHTREPFVSLWGSTFWWKLHKAQIPYHAIIFIVLLLLLIICKSVENLKELERIWNTLPPCRRDQESKLLVALADLDRPVREPSIDKSFRKNRQNHKGKVEK